MKRTLSFLLAFALMCSFAPAVFAAEASGTAYPSTQKVDVDGKAVEFQCYALKDAAGNDTNYIKLRDLANILNGSTAQFEVGWDGAVNIETGKAYTRNGSEMSTPFSGMRAYKAAAAPTNVNGKAAELDAIVLQDDGGNGYTYYKLRDLGKALGITVDWSAERGIFIETKGREMPNVTVFSKDGSKTQSVPVTSVMQYVDQGWSALPPEMPVDEKHFQIYDVDDFSAEETGGEEGDVTWEYADGCLVIGGEGGLYSFKKYWSNKSDITQIYVKRGVDLGSFSFDDHPALQRVELPDTLEALDDDSFDNSRLSRVGIPSSVTKLSDIYSTAFGDYTTEYIEDEEMPSWKWETEYVLKNRNLVIYCEPGSKASEFADEYNVRQVAATQVFYPDGRTCMVSSREKKDYLDRGWCEEPVTLMYNADGEVKAVALDKVSQQTGWYQSIDDFSVRYNDEGASKVFGKDELEAAEKQGWHSRDEIKATVYSENRTALEVPKGAVTAYEQAGWHANEEDAKVTLYALDGRTKKVWQDEVEANEKVGWYRNRADVYVTMYAPDGRTQEVPKGQVEANKKVGWYTSVEEAKVTMYAADGRTQKVWQTEVEAYKKVGWYANKSDVYTTMYAMDGRTQEVLKSQVEANKKVGWYANKSDVYTTMYAPDGRTQEVLKSQVEANKKVGWYASEDEAKVTMYAPDGRTQKVWRAEVEANKAVGWYTSADDAKVTMYAPDGRTQKVWPSEVETYKKVGWYANKSEVYTTMYALDGRTQEVLNSQVAANQKVGWYLFPDYLCAQVDDLVSTDGYSAAVYYMEYFMEEYFWEDYYYQLVAKRNSLCEAWKKQIKCPIAILDNWISYNSIGTPEVHITYRNLTGLTVNAFEDQFTCIDAYGDVTTDYDDLYNGTIRNHSDHANIEPYGTKSGSVTLYSNERTTSIRDHHIVRAAFSDGTIWTR